jgi:benzoyl-CoA reductase/2-hydroxyglutaryl-CoA dehydratase subunit BcrC/BadD/HgdB
MLRLQREGNAMNPVVSHIATNWKTSLQGVLSATVAIGLYCVTLPPQVIPPHVGVIIAAISGGAKVILGLIQSDAKPSVSSSVTIETTVPK